MLVEGMGKCSFSRARHSTDPEKYSAIEKYFSQFKTLKYYPITSHCSICHCTIVSSNCKSRQDEWNYVPNLIRLDLITDERLSILITRCAYLWFQLRLKWLYNTRLSLTTPANRAENAVTKLIYSENNQTANEENSKHCRYDECEAQGWKEWIKPII